MLHAVMPWLLNLKLCRLRTVAISERPLVGTMNKCPDGLQNDSLGGFAGVPQVSQAMDYIGCPNIPNDYCRCDVLKTQFGIPL